MAGDTWSDIKLSEIIDVKHGFAFPGENIRDEPPGDILLTPGNFAVGGGFKGDKYKYFDGHVPEEYVLHANDLIITMTDLSKQADTLGYPALVPKLQGSRFLHNQRLGKVLVRDGAKIDKRFISYLLRTPAYRHEVLAGATGTTVKHTSPSRILAFKTSIPPLPEQRAIAYVLGTLDDKIELNRRMNETLEAMARALFKSWFVDFDPVRAKAGGRDPSLPKPLADLFPDSFEDSDLGEIPKGWGATRWGALVTLEYGKSLGDYAGDYGAYPVYGTNGKIGSHSAPLCDHPGIVIGRKGAYRGVHFCSTPFFVIDTGFYVEPKEPAELRWAYYELLRQDINSMDSGSAIPSTSREDFYSLPVVSPPFGVQKAFVQLLSPCWARQDRNDAESHTLACLRDALLPKLVSGELKVKGAERLAESTA
jgi:type I restriction enzyme S subunit